MSAVQMCNGEIESIGISSLSDPPGSGTEYMPQCKTCKRWAGKGTLFFADMQEFITYQFLECDENKTVCKNWIQK